MPKSNRKPPSRQPGFLERQLSHRALDLWLSQERASDERQEACQKFETWKREHPDHHRAADDLDAFLNSPELKKAMENADRAEIKKKRSVAPVQKNRWKTRVWAAAVLLVLVISLQSSSLPIWLQADYSTKVGEQYRGELADGSTLILNTNSAVQVSFTPHGRKVRLLQGEALFEVVPNADRPFIVEMHRQKLTVVGTRFIARVHRDTEQAIILEGQVRARSMTNDLDPDLILKARDHMTLTGREDLTVTRSSESPSWLEGRLTFEDTPLREVVDEMNRYFSGTIFIANDRLNAKRLTATYHLDKLDQALNIMADTLDFEVYRLGPITLLR